MADITEALDVGKKVSQHGKKIGSLLSRARESVTSTVASLKETDRPKVVLKLPLNKRIGKVTYTVESSLNPVTFTKRKDAEQFRSLLEASVHGHKSDIVRREITDEGYHLQ